MPKPLAQLIEVWNRLKPAQRLAVVGALVGTVALIGALVYYGAQPEYRVLFSELKTSDAQNIIEKLKTANVPYQLSNGGTTVSVPSDKVLEMRVQLAAEGAIGGGHVGFGLFDKGSFGMTDFMQEVNYQRALEGELAKTIEGLEEIETARVHIAKARESLFTEKDKPAKASVMLRLKSGRQMSRERVETVTNLVASAIDRLSPNDVSVMDSKGRLLSSPDQTGDAHGEDEFSRQWNAKQRVESALAARIEEQLEMVAGMGRVRANVAADIDFSKIEQKEEKFDDKPVARSQQTIQETRNTPSGKAGDVVGARANDPAAKPTPAPTTPNAPSVPGAQPAPASLGTAATGDSRLSQTVNNEISNIVKTITGGAGSLKRLSASVLIDQRLENGKSVPRSPEELSSLREIVNASIGFDEARKDLVVVKSLPFDQHTIEGTAPWWERFRDLLQLGVKYGALLAAALLLVFFVARPASRALRQAASAPAALPEGTTVAALTTGTEVAGQNRLTDASRTSLPPGETERQAAAQRALEGSAPRTVAELEAQMAIEIGEEMESAQTVPVVKRSGAIKKMLIDRTQKDPELLAMTLRSWLKEKESR